MNIKILFLTVCLSVVTVHAVQNENSALLQYYSQSFGKGFCLGMVSGGYLKGADELEMALPLLGWLGSAGIVTRDVIRQTREDEEQQNLAILAGYGLGTATTFVSISVLGNGWNLEK